jgi:hypothetical protein
MKYTLLIYQGSTATPDDPGAWASTSEEQRQEIYRGYQSLSQAPGYEPGPWMAGPDTATTVRVQEDQVLTTDGPFAELKEAVGGLFTIDVDDLDAAIEWAAKVPAARFGGAIEIRPQRQGSY